MSFKINIVFKIENLIEISFAFYNIILSFIDIILININTIIHQFDIC